MTKRYLTILTVILAMLAIGCGDDGDTTTSEPPPDGAESPSEPEDEGSEGGGESAPENPGEDVADELVDDLTDLQQSEGGGSATLTIGDQSWTFDSVLCAFGEEQIGQEGAEFVLSSIQDGMQMYASIDSFGHSVSLDDVEDFQNPSVSVASAFGADGFIVLDGKNVSAEVGFIDNTADSFDETPGTFTATCP